MHPFLRSTLAALAALLIPSSCSLTNPSVSDCAQQEAPDLFCSMSIGPGSTCQGDGYCSGVEQGLVDCRSELDPEAFCRASNAPGSVCVEETGLCTEAQLNPRCARTVPEDYFQRPDLYSDHILIGSAFREDVDLIRDSVALAFKQVNSSDLRGLDGTNFAVVFCNYGGEEGQYADGLDTLESAESVGVYLADTLKVPAIIGAWGSSETSAVFSGIQGKEVVLISPSSTSPALTEIDVTAPTDDAPGFLWRTAPPDSLQGEVIAADIVARRQEALAQGPDESATNSVGILYQEGAYGGGLNDILIAEIASQSGGAIEVASFGYEAESTELAARIVSFLDATAESDSEPFDELILITSNVDEMVTFFSSVNVEPIGDRVVFLPDIGYDPALLEQLKRVPDFIDNIRGSRPAPPELDDPLYKSFLEDVSDEYGYDGSTAVFINNVYDATWLIFYASAYSYYNFDGAVTGLGIARGLRRMSGPEDAREIKPQSWAPIQNAFRQGDASTTINVRGTSGDLDYDPATEETSAPIETWRVKPGADGFERIAIVNP